MFVPVMRGTGTQRSAAGDRAQRIASGLGKIKPGRDGKGRTLEVEPG